MDKKLAVAMFGQKRLSREGGVEIVVKELCTRMARDGYEVTCFNRGGHHVSGAEYDQAVEYKGVRQKTVPTIDAKGLAAVSSSGFAALCNFSCKSSTFDFWKINALSSTTSAHSGMSDTKQQLP